MTVIVGLQGATFFISGQRPRAANVTACAAHARELEAAAERASSTLPPPCLQLSSTAGTSARPRHWRVWATAVRLVLRLRAAAELTAERRVGARERERADDERAGDRRERERERERECVASRRKARDAQIAAAAAERRAQLAAAEEAARRRWQNPARMPPPPPPTLPSPTPPSDTWQARRAAAGARAAEQRRSAAGAPPESGIVHAQTSCPRAPLMPASIPADCLADSNRRCDSSTADSIQRCAADPTRREAGGGAAADGAAVGLHLVPSRRHMIHAASADTLGAIPVRAVSAALTPLVSAPAPVPAPAAPCSGQVGMGIQQRGRLLGSGGAGALAQPHQAGVTGTVAPHEQPPLPHLDGARCLERGVRRRQSLRASQSPARCGSRRGRGSARRTEAC